MSYLSTMGCSYAGQHISNTLGLMTPSSAPPGCGSTAALTLQRQKQVGRVSPEWFLLAPSHSRWPHFQVDRQLPHIKHKLLSPLQRHVSLAPLTRLYSFGLQLVHGQSKALAEQMHARCNKLPRCIQWPKEGKVAEPGCICSLPVPRQFAIPCYPV